MILNLILGFLALLSLALTLWQWLVARRFPLHQRVTAPAPPSDPCRSRREEAQTSSSQPPVTLLKPLKGCDAATEDCLRSWFAQRYTGARQILFGVAKPTDPVCAIVRKLMQEFPGSDAQLIVCCPPLSANAKVSQLVELERLAKHDLLVISDADVRVPPDLLVNLAVSLQQPQVGLVNCFYRLANPTTLAMHWEAIAINADFWSQVLQPKSLKPMDFALGAVMATRRKQLAEINGFKALANCLADDYQLGNRIARRGYGIVLSPLVVECWSAPMGWAAVWKHQLRWSRTIRACQPVPYFFSLLSNATLWPLLWLLAKPAALVWACALFCWLTRILTALDLQRRLSPPTTPGGRASPRAQTSPEDGAREDARPPAPAPWRYAWLIPLKDLLQVAIWLLAFLGNRIEWRGQRMRLRRDGSLAPD